MGKRNTALHTSILGGPCSEKSRWKKILHKAEEGGNPDAQIAVFVSEQHELLAGWSVLGVRGIFFGHSHGRNSKTSRRK